MHCKPYHARHASLSWHLRVFMSQYAMTKNNQKTITIPEDFYGKRLDQALAQMMPEYSRAQIQTWIKSGHATINGKPAKTNTKLKGHEEVTITVQDRVVESWEAQEIPLNIVHEDDDVLIINKPVGLVVHPGSGVSSNTLLNALLHHAPALQKLPRAGIIHRIDKNTSGLLAIAKTETAFRSLSLQLKKRTMSREYKAIVYGAMISGGTVDAPIDRNPLERKRMAVVETGRHATTHYRIAEKFRNHTLLSLKLETGRTHQIRVHMHHIRHPIVGDSIYGGRTRLSKGMSEELITALREFKRQALHAFALGFIHPVTGEAVLYKADLPDDMQALVKILREDVHEHRYT